MGYFFPSSWPRFCLVNSSLDGYVVLTYALGTVETDSSGTRTLPFHIEDVSAAVAIHNPIFFRTFISAVPLCVARLAFLVLVAAKFGGG